ncbi:MAG: outer membrane protein assembly factor BamA [Desulfobacterales bacterium]|nr:outer membrane protein assembly factor BamA [Desulfobacterales bacterium]
MTFSGVNSISKQDLSETLSAQVPNRLKIWIRKPVLTEEDLHEDVDKIRRFYQAYGYFHVKVEYSLKRMKDIAQKEAAGPLAPGYTAEVTFTVTEGAQVKISAVEIRMKNAAGMDLESALRANLPVQEGAAFEIAKYREAKVLIQKELGNRGYPFAKVTSNVVVDTASETARISFDIDSGMKCVFGPMEVSKQEMAIKDEIIERAVTVAPGAPYETRKIEQSQRNLFNLDVFKSALIRTEPPKTAGDNHVPLHLELKPKKQQSVKFGLGYGNEDGVRVKTGWIYRNFGGWAGRFSLNGKLSDLYQGIEGDYTQPYFMDARNTLSAAAGTETETLDSYDNRKIFGRLDLKRKYLSNWEVICGYALEMNNLEDLSVTDPEELRQFRKDKDYLISSFGLGVSRSTVDNEINPTKGQTVSFLVELASEYFGSNIAYVRPDMEFKTYMVSWFQTIVACRFRAQTINDFGNTTYIPIFKRLFLGGSNTVRGYGYQELGPLDDTGTPLGGLSFLNANIELRRSLYESISGVLFLDAGTVEEKAFDFPLDKLRYAGGAGLRYDTPIGPVRLDYGYQLNPLTEEDDRWRIHFSIGHTF